MKELEHFAFSGYRKELYIFKFVRIPTFYSPFRVTSWFEYPATFVTGAIETMRKKKKTIGK